MGEGRGVGALGAFLVLLCTDEDSVGLAVAFVTGASDAPITSQKGSS